jgi:hypothetical protein
MRLLWFSFRKQRNDPSTDGHGLPGPGKGPWHVKNHEGRWFDCLHGQPGFPKWLCCCRDPSEILTGLE